MGGEQGNTIGIDVDSKNLVCCIRRDEKEEPQATFANCNAGHRKLIRWATRRNQSARVCLEATGVYSIPPLTTRLAALAWTRLR